MAQWRALPVHVKEWSSGSPQWTPYRLVQCRVLSEHEWVSGMAVWKTVRNLRVPYKEEKDSMNEWPVVLQIKFSDILNPLSSTFFIPRWKLWKFLVEFTSLFVGLEDKCFRVCELGASWRYGCKLSSYGTWYRVTEDGSRMFPRNVARPLPSYAASYPGNT